jgi:predicted  nucleic acid-binding Zn-ribbon protein
MTSFPIIYSLVGSHLELAAQNDPLRSLRQESQNLREQTLSQQDTIDLLRSRLKIAEFDRDVAIAARRDLASKLETLSIDKESHQINGHKIDESIKIGSQGVAATSQLKSSIDQTKKAVDQTKSAVDQSSEATTLRLEELKIQTNPLRNTPVLIALIGAISSFLMAAISAFVSIMTHRLASNHSATLKQTQISVSATNSAIEETKDTIHQLEKNTNGLNEALLQSTKEAAYAQGIKDTLTLPQPT